MSTLSELRTKVQEKLGLDSTSSSTEETLLTQWLNEGVVDVLLRTRVNVNESTMTTTANTGDYVLDSDILAFQDLTYTSAADGTVSQLTRVNPEVILRYRAINPATPAKARFYALNGQDLLMLYPTPSAADTLTVYYTPRPSSMNLSADDPSSESLGGIPTEYHKAIELFALAEAAEFSDHQPSQFGALFRQQYEAKLNEIKRAMRHRGGRSMGPAILGRHRNLVGANSQYPR